MIKRSWQTLSSKIVYQNKWIKLWEDKVINPGGQKDIYTYLDKVPGVFVIAKDTDGSIYLLKQYRYPVKKFIYELPAGSVEKSLTLLTTAKKELFEEAGITAKKWQKLGTYFIAAGHETNTITVFLATNLDTSKQGITGQDGDENISQVIKVSPEKLKKMINSDQIKCGVSLAALALYFKL